MNNKREVVTMARHAEKPAVERARTYEAYNQAGRRVRCTVPE